MAQSGPDIRHWRCLLMGAKRTCPRIPRTHRADPKLCIHTHSTAQKRLTTSLTAPASENRSFLKATSVSKSKSDSIAECVQKIVLSFILEGLRLSLRDALLYDRLQDGGCRG